MDQARAAARSGHGERPNLLCTLSTIRDTLRELEMRFLAHEGMLGIVKSRKFASNMQVTRTCMQWVCDNLDMLRRLPPPSTARTPLHSICLLYSKMLRIEEMCSTSGVITEQAMQELIDADSEYRQLDS